jgi:nucleotide-binding universal stress UspA family protein
MAYKRILVPVDGSVVSDRGLKEAMRMARADGARVRLLHVVAEYMAYANTEAAVDIGPVLDGLREGGRKTLSKVERRVRGNGARIESSLVENPGGRVADSIVEEAKRWKADLIVMGTHGRRGVKRMLLGSDAELVIRHSRVPVLLVPAAKGRL